MRKDGKMSLIISDHNFRISKGVTFNPAVELKNAIQMIREGKTLTFKEEYTVEALWHEILHCKAKGWVDYKYSKGAKNNVMETLNHFVARQSYDGFLSKLGGKAVHKAAVITDGYGYDKYLNNFYDMLNGNKIAKSEAFTFFKDKLITTKYEDLEEVLSDFLKDKSVRNPKSVIKSIFQL
jgi:hypothetical protein